MIDQNGKLFGKISIIDIFVLVMVAVVGAGLVLKTQNKKVEQQATIRYTFEILGIRERALTFYEKGLQVVELKTGARMGEIVETEAVPLVDLLALDDGTMTEAEKVEHLKMKLTIETPGTVTDRAYMANGTFEIKAGSFLGIRTKYFEVYGRIMEVSEV